MVFFRLFILLLGLLWSGVTASAHTLEKDGSMGVILHIDPDDAPIAQAPSDLFIELKDKTDKFSPSECDCELSIIKAGEEILRAPLSFQANASNSGVTNFLFTFPESNVYQVKITGQPIQPDDFQSFAVTFAVRVEKAAAQAVPTVTQQTLDLHEHGAHLALFIATLLFFGAAMWFQRKKTSRGRGLQKMIFFSVIFSLVLLHGVCYLASHVEKGEQVYHLCCLGPTAVASVSSFAAPRMPAEPLFVPEQEQAAYGFVTLPSNKSPPFA